MRFRTTVDLNGRTATGMRVPPEIVEALGSGKRPPVLVTINGYTYRSTVAVMGGESLIGVSSEHRAGAGVAAGDEVDVELQLDTAARTVKVPADFAAALGRTPSLAELTVELTRLDAAYRAGTRTTPWPRAYADAFVNG